MHDTVPANRKRVRVPAKSFNIAKVSIGQRGRRGSADARRVPQRDAAGASTARTWRTSADLPRHVELAVHPAGPASARRSPASPSSAASLAHLSAPRPAAPPSGPPSGVRAEHRRHPRRVDARAPRRVDHEHPAPPPGAPRSPRAAAAYRAHVHPQARAPRGALHRHRAPARGLAPPAAAAPAPGALRNRLRSAGSRASRAPPRSTQPVAAAQDLERRRVRPRALVRRGRAAPRRCARCRAAPSRPAPSASAAANAWRTCTN